jgi:hypothetical protein
LKPVKYPQSSYFPCSFGDNRDMPLSRRSYTVTEPVGYIETAEDDGHVGGDGIGEFKNVANFFWIVILGLGVDESLETGELG